MNKYWTDLVKRLTPYVPGEQRSGTDVVKLNTNENPYAPSPRVKEAINGVSGDSLRRYPDPQALALCSSLASYHGVTTDQVFVGNGSDEILALAFMAFFTGSKPLQFPSISYSFYPVYCDLLNIEQQTTPVDENFCLDLNGFNSSGGGIIFPNPNAPTSLAVSREQITALLKRVPDTLVLVDEAYADFGAESSIELIEEYPNLVVSRTFSKGRSLAGLRLGAAFANADLIEALRRVKDSFNSYPVDTLAQAAGIASIDDEKYYRHTIDKVVQTRDWTTAQLQDRGYRVLPSSANFLFVSPDGIKASSLFNALREQNILLRYWAKEPLSNWLRITIGTSAEMERLIAAIDNITRKKDH
ncbi:histidinol-phosphate transaminase [Chromatiales bacterium (ex Bugula neritina AB1)]|nr:histidinol-phosphate transaminase [Chromatiales bacterium (ex Bugula neritina AB1)]